MPRRTYIGPVAAGMQTCGKCHADKPAEEYVNAKGLPVKWCRHCRYMNQTFKRRMRGLPEVDPSPWVWLDAWLALHLPMPVEERI